MRQERDASDSFRFLADLAAQIRPLKVPDDSQLARLTIEHRMHGLAMSALASMDNGNAARLRSELADVDMETWARHRFLAKEFEHVSSRLSNAGIVHYLIKGLAVEHCFYKREGERPTGDLDVVLAPGTSLKTALEALHPADLDIDLAAKLGDHGWIQAVDLHSPSGVPVDLHLDPLKLGFPSRFAHLAIGHLEPAIIDETEVSVLDPTASLVLALLHLNRNRFRYLGGFAEVKRILDSSAIDWSAFRRLVEADGMDVLILSSLSAVTELLDLDWPAGLEQRPPTSRFRVRQVIWDIAWRPSTRLSGTAGRFRLGRRSQFLMPALCRGRLLWVVGWMLRRLLPPRSVVAWNHPDVAGPYAWRLVRGRWERIRHNRLHRRSIAAADTSGPETGAESH